MNAVGAENEEARMSTTKPVVKKLALNRETVRGLSVRSGVLTGVQAGNSSADTWPPNWGNTQGPSNNAASAASGMPVSVDAGFHLQGGLVGVTKMLPPP